MNMSLMMDSWISLALAIFFGALGTVCLKLSNGLTKLMPVACLSLFYALSFTALTFAMKYIELSVVYAVWSGVGTILVAGIGFFYFHESFSAKKIIFLFLIIIGVIGIQLSEVHSQF